MKIIPQADNAEEVEFISNNVLFSSVFVTQYGSKFWNTLNLDPDPEFWPNLELDTDSELSYQFWKKKLKKNYVGKLVLSTKKNLVLLKK